MDKTQWYIREANNSDTSNLAKCMKKAYSVYLDRLGETSLPPMNIDYAEEIASFPVWVVEKDKEIVGALILMFENDYVKIANIAVRPDFQGKGVGRKLMGFAESKARSKGYLQMRLATHVLLTENISYYLRLGWEETSRDDNRVYMKKNINATESNNNSPLLY